mmetsp:Transcript_39745/g.128644  ORF Transcript_39745/g.128644 Transcript_39745/m.128644 type:complete len:201 (-) Transcript_39745:581-1183(-)
MRAVHRLQVGLRVPVAVVDDDRVGRLQVNAEPARARGEEEEEAVRVGLVEGVNHLLPLRPARRSVDAAIVKAILVPVGAVVLEDVEHARHLREEEHAVASPLEPAEQLVEEYHLPAVEDEALVVDERRLLRAVEQVRVVGTFAQLHQDVVHAAAVVALHRVEHVDVFGEDVLVPGALQLRHANQQLDLALGWQVLLHLLL